MSFPSQAEYEFLVYDLPRTHPDVVSSSLHLYTTSRGTAVVRGNVRLRNGLELRVTEVVDFVAGRITDYSYTLFDGQERVRWNDPQPHPGIPELASTFPHHYHALPDIKHNRHPAPEISFTEPNLPTVIRRPPRCRRARTLRQADCASHLPRCVARGVEVWCFRCPALKKAPGTDMLAARVRAPAPRRPRRPPYPSVHRSPVDS